MSGELRGDAGPRMSPPILGVLVILIGIGSAAFVLRVSATDPEPTTRVAFVGPTWHLTPGERKVLDKVIARRRAVKVDPAEPTTRRLLDAYARFNRADLKARGSVKSALFQDAYAGFQQRANAHFLRQGKAAYVALGQWVADRLLTALQSGDRRQIERLGGSLYRELRGFGLLDRKRRVRRRATTMVHAMLMQRWARILREHRVVRDLVHPLEVALLLRWKLVAHPTLPFKRRMEVARSLTRLDSTYPTREALAYRAALARDWKTAVHFYREAATRRPDNRQLAARLRLAERRLSESQAPAR